MIERITWEKFREDGFLWVTNMILHLFGLSLVYEYGEDGKLTGVFPARVKFRGFSEEDNTRGYKNVSQFMRDNAEILFQEVKE